MTDAEIVEAVRRGSHVLVPVDRAEHVITGHAPLDLDGVEQQRDSFAVYIDGLTSDEAWLILKASRPTPDNGETDA